MADSIYYIFDSKRPSFMYIGQSTQGTGTERPKQHFSGLYHVDDTGAPTPSSESQEFRDWLLKTDLRNVRCYVFTGPDYGIPQSVWQFFNTNWSPSLQHINSTNTAVRSLNMAEIIHIYYWAKQNKHLLQSSMGGQNVVTYSKLKDSNGNPLPLTLNRQMNSTDLISLVEGSPVPLSTLQAELNKTLDQYVFADSQFLQLLLSTIVSSKNQNLYTALKNKISHFFKQPYGHALLQKAISQAERKYKHVISISVTMNNNASFTFRSKVSGKHHDMKEGFYKQLANILVISAKKISSLQDLQNAFQNWSGSISIGTLFDIKINSTIQMPSFSLSMTGGNNISDALADNLKRISYFFFAKHADSFKKEVQSLGPVTSAISIDDGLTEQYLQIHGETFSSYMYNFYRSANISNPFTKNWDRWREFAAGMFGIYCRSRGYLWGSKMTMQQLPQAGQTIFAGAFENNTVTDPQSQKLFIPFHAFSEETWERIVANFDTSIQDLQIY